MLVRDGNRFLPVLQLLVHCPPFWNLFRSLGRSMDQCEAGETGGVATPLVDATVRFLDGFTNKGKSPVAQQFLQQAARGKVRENDERQEDCGVDLFTPTSVYYAMKDKRPFINVSIRSLSV
jgi:ubiquitin carboxyl-terminal hydrolase 10